MLTVTRKAAALLKAAKAAEGAAPESAIRIRRGTTDAGNRGLAVGFAVSTAPSPGDESFEQNGLRIYVEESLVEPLDGRTLDVLNDGDGAPELVFR